jgi:hypothetical protein
MYVDLTMFLNVDQWNLFKYLNQLRRFLYIVQMLAVERPIVGDYASTRSEVADV